MSRSLNLKHGFFAIGALCVVSVAVALNDGQRTASENARTPAAALPMNAMGKHLAPISLKLEVDGEIPQKDSQEVDISAYISLNQEIDSDLSFEWILPPGVQLVNGDRKGSWNDLYPGETGTLSIRVAGFSQKTAKQIVLQAHVQKGNDNLGQSALVSSRPEDNFEHIAPDIRRHVEKTRAKEFRRGRLIK